MDKILIKAFETFYCLNIRPTKHHLVTLAMTYGRNKTADRYDELMARVDEIIALKNLNLDDTNRLVYTMCKV